VLIQKCTHGIWRLGKFLVLPYEWNASLQFMGKISCSGIRACGPQVARDPHDKNMFVLVVYWGLICLFINSQ